jgi:hypothetical protein
VSTLTKALVCLFSQPTPNNLICGAVGRENLWHTYFSCVVESKTRSLGATSHTTWSRCACVCIWWIGEMTPFARFFLLFDDFETWVMLLYCLSLFYACSWACIFFIAHSPSWIFLEWDKIKRNAWSFICGMDGEWMEWWLLTPRVEV